MEVRIQNELYYIILITPIHCYIIIYISINLVTQSTHNGKGISLYPYSAVSSKLIFHIIFKLSVLSFWTLYSVTNNNDRTNQTW